MGRARYMRDLEWMLRELENQWNRSGVGKWKVEVPKDVVSKYLRKSAQMNRTLEHATADEEREQSLYINMRLKKEAYILIRIGRKILEASREQKEMFWLTLTLDEEEYPVFMKLFADLL